jgi:acylphosphatase
MAQAARHLFYAGHVQGVGFRYSVKQIASGFDVTGYVRNLPDGQVELWIQGEKEELAAMEEDILKSHLKGFIREIKALDHAKDSALRGFEIRK